MADVYALLIIEGRRQWVCDEIRKVALQVFEEWEIQEISLCRTRSFEPSQNRRPTSAARIPRAITRFSTKENPTVGWPGYMVDKQMQAITLGIPLNKMLLKEVMRGGL